ncbi:alpha/beta fold hydrolase [Streptomyces sp. NPDC006784]|uniref:alpha/beta fold hydrolase n=1 Tax=Streptomyces sp. NPDC006784 TaxID=3364764 RepID=UPI0036A134EF
MAGVRVNGVGLFYETVGTGDPLVLVHGSWADRRSWEQVLPDLAQEYRVLVYDRRGHSQSERPARQGSRTEDEDDLGALLDELGFAPAYVAGNSFGASIALGLATRRPELFRGLIAHEPPLAGIVTGEPELRPLMDATDQKIGSVLAHLRAGETQAGARLFVEEVALGPGAWEQLPEQVRETFLRNAPTFLDEQKDPGWAALDLTALSQFTGPALVTGGTASPPWFATVTARIADALPQAQVHTFEGAGHIPHVTHPRDYVDAVTRFLRTAGGRR